MRVDLDTPEHELCSRALDDRAREIRYQTKRANDWKERAEKAEALVAAYRTVLGGMRDLTLGLSRMIDEGLDTTSASNDKSTGPSPR